MKTPARLHNFIREFADVGPETKGYSFEIVLTFLACISLAAFLYFSFEKQSAEFAADSTQIEDLNQINYEDFGIAPIR